VVSELVRAPQLDTEVGRGAVRPGAPAGKAHNDALVHPQIGEDVVKLGDDVLLDRLLPGLALDGQPERGERVGLLGEDVDLVPAIRPAFQHDVALGLVAVTLEVRSHALFEPPALIRCLAHRLDRTPRA
jgi:hypothetical protein